MFCIKCGRQNPDEAKFCIGCGASVKSPSLSGVSPHHLAVGTVLANRYRIGKAIGEGGFGITYEGIDQTLELKIAVKEYFPSGYANRNNSFSNNVSLNPSKNTDFFKEGKQSFLREAKSIARFSRERGIVDVRDFFTENNTAYIVMEFLDGKTLAQYLCEKGVFSADELIGMIRPLMYSLEKMHKQSIIHRDISPDNIMLLNDGGVKLMDFGAARYFSGGETRSMSVVLKQGYAPFEQYTKKGKQGPWTDVYGMCATLYKCITGVTPPDSLDRSVSDDLKKPSQLGIKISPRIEKAIMSGLEIKVENRCQSMKELLDIIDGKTVFEKTIAADPVQAVKSDEKTVAADPVQAEKVGERTVAADPAREDKADERTVAADPQIFDKNGNYSYVPPGNQAKNYYKDTSNRWGPVPPAPPVYDQRKQETPVNTAQPGKVQGIVTAILSLLMASLIIEPLIFTIEYSGDDIFFPVLLAFSAIACSIVGAVFIFLRKKIAPVFTLGGALFLAAYTFEHIEYFYFGFSSIYSQTIAHIFSILTFICAVAVLVLSMKALHKNYPKKN